MDNENSIDENYSELKKCLACGKQNWVVGEPASQMEESKNKVRIPGMMNY